MKPYAFYGKKRVELLATDTKPLMNERAFDLSVDTYGVSTQKLVMET